MEHRKVWSNSRAMSFFREMEICSWSDERRIAALLLLILRTIMTDFLLLLYFNKTMKR